MANNSSRRIVSGVLLAGLLFLQATCAFGAAAKSASPPNEVDRLVRDVCGKDVVMLGEDAHHGSGTTLETKAMLVRRLVDECGFSAVFFESSIYDFMDLERAFADKTATSAQLADAIGGLWSTTREADPLIAYLFERARTGAVRLGGLDPQLGSATGLYTQRRLADEFGTYLPDDRRQTCRYEIDRLGNWRYEGEHDYDDTVRARLRSCADDIERAAGRHGDAAAARVAQMAVNLRRYIDMPASPFNVRDQAMYDNLAWLRARLPRAAKVVVWCATVHASKADIPGRPGAVPMGIHVHRALGDRAAAIGFSALGGGYAPMGSPDATLPPAASGSLEQRAFEALGGDLRYLDGRKLAALGTIEARPLDYTRPAAANWAGMLDGLVVLREERPVHRVRPARPQSLAESSSDSAKAAAVPAPQSGSR
jgi:erythromycin esterase-like protein